MQIGGGTRNDRSIIGIVQIGEVKTEDGKVRVDRVTLVRGGKESGLFFQLGV